MQKQVCVILGNCQTRPLAFYLSHYVTDIEFVPFEIFSLTDQEKNLLKNILAVKNVFILTQNIFDEKYSFLRTEELRKEHPNVISISNFHFTGLFPDIIYVGHGEDRVRSAALDYNSRIVFENFLAQKSVEDCVRSFSSKTYEALGFFATYEKSAAELLRREEYVDVKYAAEFLDAIKERQVQFTINHPCDVVFDEYARKIAATLGWKIATRFPASLYPNFLSGVWNAVYKEIAEFHGIPYACNTCYVVNRRRLSLEDFCRESYAAYRNQFDKILKYQLDNFKKTNAEEFHLTNLIIAIYKSTLKRAPDYHGFYSVYNYIKENGFNATTMTRTLNKISLSEEFQRKFNAQATA